MYFNDYHASFNIKGVYTPKPNLIKDYELIIVMKKKS